MELGEKLKELNMTADEVERFSEAFKDEKFRTMLRDYAREISDPENRKKYEEEIKILEQERGNTIEFIHPKPFRAIKTSVDGKHKCFINICASDKVGKPASEWAVSEDGRRGQCWSLPHSLHPGRQDIDPKGNKMMIYDVVFHPDTLHMASKNKSFLEMVDSTAIQGIQDAFKVSLDKKNVREIKTKYKGTPQPCVIRKPIPGFTTKEPSDPPDPFAFPYPDEKRPQSKPTETPKTKNSSDVKPQSLEKTRGSTKPHYTVKYRSCIDLQDFRCSRDSAQSPRPKEIVVTVDLPLLKSTKDTSLEVKEKKLLLESKKPAYRLELPLAYPVDEDKAEAKFNKQKRQLIVTLPVLPHKFDLFAGPTTGESESESDGESQEDKSGVEEEEKWKKRAGKKSEQEQEVCAEGKEERQTEDLEQEEGVENSEKEEVGVQEKGEEQIREEATGEEEAKLKMGKKGQESVEEERGTEGYKGTEVQEEDKLKEQKQPAKRGNQDEDSEKGNHQESSEDGCDRAAEDDSQCDTVKERGISAEKEISAADDKDLAAVVTKKKVVNLASSLEATPKVKPSDIQEETEKTKSSVAGKLQVELEAAFQNQTSSDKTQGGAMTAAAEDCYFPEKAVKSSEMSAAGDVKTSSRELRQMVICSEELAAGSAKQEREEMDEDDIQKAQISPILEDNSKPPPAILREIDEDGNETVITDHTTSAGFTFQNTLMYDLD